MNLDNPDSLKGVHTFTSFDVAGHMIYHVKMFMRCAL